MIEETSITPFRVIDLKQYVYCPRILYYHTVLPQVRPITYKMEAGIAAQQQVEAREKRRSLRAYGLQSGRRYFNVPLYAPLLGLSGSVDMVVETETELIPIDFKNAKREGAHYRLQLMAYGQMLETADPKSTRTVKRGFLYLIPQRKAVAVPFTRALRRRLAESIEQLQHMAEKQQMPTPTKHTSRCVDCEFRRFCNDMM